VALTILPSDGDLKTAARRPDPQFRFRVESLLLLILAGLFVVAGHHFQWFSGFDRLLYDAGIQRMTIEPDRNIVIVGIDDKSLHAYGPWPWPRSIQAELLLAINAHQPAKVAVDIIYAGTSPDDPPLVAAASQIEHLILPMMIESLGARQQHIEVLPFTDLLSKADQLGHVHVELDEDAIVRGTYLYQGVGTPHWPHLALALAGVDTYTPAEDCTTTAPSSLFLTKCNYVGIRFAGESGAFSQVSALDLLQPSNDALLTQALTGRTVLVGLTASGAGDWVTSPVSGDSGPLPGVEFNANLLNSIIHNKLVAPLPAYWAIFIGLLLVSTCSFMLPRLKPKQVLLATVTFALIPIGISAGLLLQGYFLASAATTVAVLLLYPLWSWRRHEIAWQFISRELTRIDDQEQLWRERSGKASTRLDQNDVISALNQLFDQTVNAVQQDNGTTLLQPDNTKSLNETQTDLLNAVNQQYFSSPTEQAVLPGEILAAQISRLETRARIVREGREMGLAGLSRMSNGVLILSAVGENQFINQAAAGLLQADPKDTSNALALLARITPPLGQSWLDIMREVVLYKSPVYFEGRSADGRPIYVSAEPLPDTSSELYAGFWVITFSDLSAIRAAQAQREEALAFLSHDIRSPLLSVLALIRGQQDASALLKDIEKYTQKGLSTSEQFLQLSRLQLQSDFERYELPLEQVVYNAIEQSFTLSREKGITITTGSGFDSELEDNGIWIYANGELLERAFVNLLVNAIKYSPSNSNITIDLIVESSKVQILFTDQGYGIPAEEIPHIFEPFFRSSEKRLAENRGAGLGLRFVKTVIERHAGSINVTSTWGAGTTFAVVLPYSANSAAQE
jgi:CHASE2 domain-containing sensor protein/signal transduction histidine kinase